MLWQCRHCPVTHARPPFHVSRASSNIGLRRFSSSAIGSDFGPGGLLSDRIGARQSVIGSDLRLAICYRIGFAPGDLVLVQISDQARSLAWVSVVESALASIVCYGATWSHRPSLRCGSFIINHILDWIFDFSFYYRIGLATAVLLSDRISNPLSDRIDPWLSVIGSDLGSDRIPHLMLELDPVL